jgi:L-ascorbate metabolism protein UlaG (beta-lactamase superfamily)
VGAHVTIVNAVHGSSLNIPKPAEGANAVTTGGNPVGLVIEIEGGPTLYHTGDTDVFTDMKLIDEFFDVDVMLACIGDHFTMGPSRAALAVEFVNPRQVIPMHFGTFPLLSGTPEALQREMSKRGVKADLVAMSPGETRNF